jgi:hypothetical protein
VKRKKQKNMNNAIQTWKTMTANLYVFRYKYINMLVIIWFKFKTLKGTLRLLTWVTGDGIRWKKLAKPEEAKTSDNKNACIITIMKFYKIICVRKNKSITTNVPFCINILAELLDGSKYLSY